MSSGAPDIPARANMSNPGEYQPLLYQNRPQSLSSIAQARLMRSGDPGLVTADGHLVNGAPSDDQPHVYQSRPQSISSMAQDRIVRSDVTGDCGAVADPGIHKRIRPCCGGQSVEEAPGFEAVGAPKNPSLIDEWGADTSDNTAAALTLSQIRPAVHSQDTDQASNMDNRLNYAGKGVNGRRQKNVNVKVRYA